ncbi:unnamed protein product [Clonostachys byssicola]|uniref:Alpha/beta hydrolase fold-3 domain-containing protein n=1 Tax=Clonostachys byssicola TaxID=160290 RepID=A0A9N9Y4T9_9HYPO|nr:unnamed protein product [Clonostachys byssicola]
MDFSKYGHPSPQWLAFVAANPSAAEEGSSGNDPSTALELQQTVNSLRDKASAKIFAESGLESRLDISTTFVPSRHGHSIPVRRYIPKQDTSRAGDEGTRNQRSLIYFHGGGFLFGTDTSEDPLCAKLALDAGISVYSVNYSHTPQHVFPVAHDDALDVYNHIIKNSALYGIDTPSGQLAVLGISAGANLAAEFVQHDVTRAKADPSHRRLVSGAVLSIPWLIHSDHTPLHLMESPEKASSRQCRDAPVLPWPRLQLFVNLLKMEDSADPRISAALRPDSELEGWPKTGFIIAGMDPLRDDGLIFAKRLEALKTSTSVHIFPGVPHGFRRWVDLPFAKQSDDVTVDLIRWALGSEPKDSIEGWHEYA